VLWIDRLTLFAVTRTARRCRWLATLMIGAALAVSVAPQPCLAQDTAPGAGESSGKKPDKADTEFTVVPFVGGNSDMGFGAGYVASLARLEPDIEPYLYRIETAGSATLGRVDSGNPGKVRVQYADIYLLFSFPNIIKDHLGFDIRISYTLEANLKYYGLGNASSVPEGMSPTGSYFEHSRTHPTLKATWEYRVKPFAISWGASYTQNWFDVPPDTRLGADIQSPDPDIRKLLGEAKTHGTPELSLGAAFDTRDDETSPVRGVYITEAIDVTPKTFGAVDYKFARLDSELRFYVPIIPNERRLVFAARVASDLLFGDAPFYELPRFDDSFAIGGAKGVRGVPGQRYYGRIKAFSNLELRSELFSAKIFGDERRFGLVGFTDFGRVWADYRSQPDLDGTGLGLKYGVGGGLRVASGETFVLRLDVAWSPDANPVSGYLLAGHIF
jgi:outer membrane protein assembly factor BamA